MSTETCKIRIPDGGRMVSSHTCGRKLSGSDDYPELCGLHAAGKRRSLARAQERREAREAADNAVTEADDLAATLTVGLGVTVSAQTRFDSNIVSHPTGFGIVKLADLQSLADRVAELETELARWHRIDGQAAL